jgi:transglutaminase-like putative cysteine protease
MQRYRILHRTYYNFLSPVQLGPHTLLLRPREGHELRLESALLTTTPPATVRWHRDVEDNSVATATFDASTSQLMIESDVVVQHFNQAPHVFLLADYAVNAPFRYAPEDEAVLAPYMKVTAATASEGALLAEWVAKVSPPGQSSQSYALLLHLASFIQQSLTYRLREEPGVQTVRETLALGTGSCRDYAFLFMEAARYLSFAARFVSGYLRSPPSTINYGATHAWAEVFLPGAGWKGFDPTLAALVGADHIPIAVARSPESVPPVAGSFTGPPGVHGSLDVGAWVTPLP